MRSGQPLDTEAEPDSQARLAAFRPPIHPARPTALKLCAEDRGKRGAETGLWPIGLAPQLRPPSLASSLPWSSTCNVAGGQVGGRPFLNSKRRRSLPARRSEHPHPPNMSDTEERTDRPSEPSANPACDQCRARKVRCDRRRPECSNCSKSGVCCGFTNQSKRVNHIKQLWVVGNARPWGWC